MKDFEYKYPHMPIAITEPAVASLSHMPRDCPVSCHAWLTSVQCIMNFSLFCLRANPRAKVHQKGRKHGSLRDLPSYKISSFYVNPRQRHPLINILQTKKKPTVTDISTACLSACGDNYLTDFNDACLCISVLIPGHLNVPE